MKAPLKYIVMSVAFIAIAVAYGQQRGDPELRVPRLQQAFQELTRAPRTIEQVVPAQDKLLEKIVDEVAFLHRENAALRKDIESLKSR